MAIATYPARAWVAPAFIKVAVLYFALGVLLGNYMGAKLDFSLSSVHAHINLLGWVSLALAGVVYTLYPVAGKSRLALFHFWLANLALPIMMVTLALFMTGTRSVGPLLGIGSAVMGLAVLLFAVNVFRNVRPKAG